MPPIGAFLQNMQVCLDHLLHEWIGALTQELLVLRIKPVQPKMMSDPGTGAGAMLIGEAAGEWFASWSVFAGDDSDLLAVPVRPQLPVVRQVAPVHLVERLSRFEMIGGIGQPIAHLSIHVVRVVAAPRRPGAICCPQPLNGNWHVSRTRTTMMFVQFGIVEVLEAALWQLNGRLAPVVSPLGFMFGP